MKLNLYATHRQGQWNNALTLLLARKRRHQTACTALPRTRFVSHWIHPANILSRVRELRFEHEEHDWLPGFLVCVKYAHKPYTYTFNRYHTHTHTYIAVSMIRTSKVEICSIFTYIFPLGWM